MGKRSKAARSSDVVKTVYVKSLFDFDALMVMSGFEDESSFLVAIFSDKLSSIRPSCVNVWHSLRKSQVGYAKNKLGVYRIGFDDDIWDRI